jgi:hypothetical protein
MKLKPETGGRGLVPCLLCNTKYSMDAIQAGELDLTSFVCLSCYRNLQEKPLEVSCFGKHTVIAMDGSKTLGYDPDSIECSSWCPDRRACGRVIRGEI